MHTLTIKQTRETNRLVALLRTLMRGQIVPLSWARAMTWRR